MSFDREQTPFERDAAIVLKALRPAQKLLSAFTGRWEDDWPDEEREAWLDLRGLEWPLRTAVELLGGEVFIPHSSVKELIVDQERERYLDKLPFDDLVFALDAGLPSEDECLARFDKEVLDAGLPLTVGTTDPPHDAA